MFESNSDPLGVLLKHFRIRCHLTQQQLATAIGVHRTTIGRWEEGSVLPESKAIVLELARHLKLDEQETRQLLEASLTAFAPYWSVPLPRNPFFTGREEILETLHTHLGVDQAVALTHSSALHGLGGVGKTQIALEYAYRYALEYRAVFWVGAETDEQIATNLLGMAEVLRLPERENKDQQRVIAAVRQWLTTHSQWLVIWDNVENLDLLQRFLPASRSGAILITTRCPTLGTLARGVNLFPMEQEEGVLFLLRRAKVLAPDAPDKHLRLFAEQASSQYSAAAALVEVTGGLPLALDQAGAYLEATQCGFPAYLELFRARRTTLLSLRGERAGDHPDSVSTTFRLALRATAERHPALPDLLQVCAILQPDAIPEELFRQGGEHLGARLEAIYRDPLEWNQVVSVACSYSLLSRQAEEHTLSLHRLVQAVLLDTMTEEERAQWSKRVIAAFDAAFPDLLSATEYAAWKQCERLLPHALLCLDPAGAAEETLVLASLANKVGRYLRERGQDAEAEPLYLRALRIREQALGPNHPEVAQVLNNLAVLDWQQDHYARAEPLFQRALHIREQALGPNHLEVARSLNNLALLSWSQGNYAEAEPLFQRALRIWKQALGPNHLEVARPLNNLANLYIDQGKYAEAEPLFQQAIQIWEQASPDHPDVAFSLCNLAELYQVQGKYEQAEPLFQRALSIREQTLGPDHTEVAHPLDNLAMIYREQGKYEQAEPLFQRALSIREQTLGPDHSLVAFPLAGLAHLCCDRGNYGEAEALYQRALSIREQQLGQQHPVTAQTLHDLAILRQKQGNLSEAISLAERALSIRTQALGAAHPKMLATRTLATQLLQEQTRIREAVLPESRARKAFHLRQKESRSTPLSKAIDPSPSSGKDDSVQAFLDACCELHPRAWCRISELWRAYEQWTVAVQQCVPLPRRAFASQINGRGCRTDRTSMARIWRGIRLRDRTP